MAPRSAVCLNACCDYNTRLGEGAVLANGSATHVGQVIPANCLAQGVPAKVVQENLDDGDRRAIFGLVPAQWTHFEGDRQEAAARGKG
jgi:carbonic anhydrase/acetyltransferase-like protein (isoleucine patch superfamily)